jgi:hypothetical protein
MATTNTSDTGPTHRLAERVDDAAQSLLERGRAVADQLPGAVDGARDMVEAASSQLDDFSDQGVIAALGLSAGVTIGLFLAGAPRVILGLALIPVAITVRAAMQRGVSPSRLVKGRGRSALPE